MAFKSVDDQFIFGSDTLLSNVQIYKGEHSIDFTKGNVTKNTWSDWGLIPSSRHSEPVNGIWSKSVSIDGVNGQEDLVRYHSYYAINSTELLNQFIVSDNPASIKSRFGYDLYLPSQGSLSFIIADQTKSFFSKQQEILNFLHNQSLLMAFTDDNLKTYTVRTSVSSFNSGAKYSGLTIDYTVISET